MYFYLKQSILVIRRTSKVIIKSQFWNFVAIMFAVITQLRALSSSIVFHVKIIMKIKCRFLREKIQLLN